MEKTPKSPPREKSAQEQYPRKVGYVAYRLSDLETAPKTKSEPKQPPFVISDWASI